MPGFLYDFSGPTWVRTKKYFVNVCVNYHGDPLLSDLRALPVAQTKERLPPVLGRWLDDRVLSALNREVVAHQGTLRGDEIAIGLALFTYSPARRSPGAEATKAPDHMSKDVGRAMPRLRQCFMRNSDTCAKATLGTTFGNHFSTAKERLMAAEAGELSLVTWWKLEKVIKDVLADCADKLKQGTPEERAQAQQIINSDQLLAQTVLENLPKKVEIKKEETVLLYMDVFGTEATEDLDELIWIGTEGSEDDEFLQLLTDCINAQSGDNALTERERNAIWREYIDGIPVGLSHKEFSNKYDVSRPTHNKDVDSARVKLGKALGRPLGEQS